MLKEVGKDIRAGPQLQQLTGKTLQSSTLTGNEVLLYICARVCNFIKERLRHRCFLVNFAKSLKAPFSIERLRLTAPKIIWQSPLISLISITNRLGF